jgi:hypothetical protein
MGRSPFFIYLIYLKEHVGKPVKACKSGKIIPHQGIIEGDFYEVDLPKSFDVNCYRDGLGIGQVWRVKKYHYVYSLAVYLPNPYSMVGAIPSSYH